MLKIALLAAAASTLALSGCTRTGSGTNPSLSVAPKVTKRYNARHYRWCAQQYTSYSRATNTYSRGSDTLGRKRCVSPYI